VTSEPVASRRATSLTLTGGALLGAILFGVAIIADLAGLGRDGPDAALDAAAFVAAMLDLRPWAWALLGSSVIIATPAVGLVVTALEYQAVADRSAVALAVGVLVVLGVSLLLAFLT
jgi:hypothetical protein